MALHVKDTDTSQSDFQTGTLTNVEADAGGYLRLKKLFPDTDLYLPEVSASGTVPNAQMVFGPVDCSGLTKANAYLSIELKCSDWSARNGETALEITSYGSPDVEEWSFNPVNLAITNTYKQFIIPLSNFETYGGELVVSRINFIRFYAYFSSPQTIYWRNAKIIGRHSTPGNRLSPQLDLSAVGTVKSSSVSWIRKLDFSLNVLSGGYTDSNTAILKLNGTDYSPNLRGLNLLRIHDSGYVEAKVWDTWGSTAESDAMAIYINNLPAGETIAIAVKDEASYCLTANLISALENRLFSTHISALATRESWLIVAVVDEYKITEKWSGGEGLGDVVYNYTGQVSIETRISTDDGTTWSAWKTCTNGGAIPDLPYGTDVSTALLECRQSLSTSDPTVTPRLESIALEINSQKFHGASLDVDSSVSLQPVQAKKAHSLSMDALAEVDSLTLQKVQNVLMDASVGGQNITLEMPALALPMDASALIIEETIQTAASSSMSVAAGNLQVSFQQALEIALKTELEHLLMGAFQQESRPPAADWRQDARPQGAWVRASRPPAADWRRK